MTVAELLDDPKNWTQNGWARTPAGNTCHFNSELACAYCLAGATLHCYPESLVAYEALEKVKAVIGQSDYVKWNDAKGRTHAEVLAAVKKAGI